MGKGVRVIGEVKWEGKEVERGCREFDGRTKEDAG